MRIAINTRFLIKGRLEGIGGFTWEVARRLAVQHPEHTFVFLFDRPFDPSFIPADNVETVVVFPPARHATLWWWWFEIAIPRVLKKHKIDLFLSPDGYCSLRTALPTVMVCHDIAHHHYPQQVPFHGRVFYQHFVPKYLKRVERIISVSSFTKADIVEHYGISPAKIKVACNGVRKEFQVLNARRKENIKALYSDGQDYFFYLGSVHPRKNVARLIEAFGLFKQATNASIKLLIGGRLAWQTGEIKTALEQSAVEQDIKLLGYIEDSRLPDLLGAALALTYPSLFEGFGVPILEAMHAEVPILTSNLSSLPEVAGEAAILVDPTNTQAMAIGLKRMYQSKTLRADLIAAGRIQRQKFSWDKATKVVWENLLELSALQNRTSG